MIYTNVSGRHRSAIKIQVTALDPGIIVDHADPAVEIEPTVSALSRVLSP